MDRRHGSVGRGGDHATRVQDRGFLAGRGVAPRSPQTCHGQHGPVAPGHVDRSLGSLGIDTDRPPLVKAGHRDDASFRRHRRTERRLLRHGLGAGVDQSGRTAGILGPTRHQTPLKVPDPSFAVAVESDRHDPRRRWHVVVRSIIVEQRRRGRLRPEELGDPIGRGERRETTAHCDHGTRNQATATSL